MAAPRLGEPERRFLRSPQTIRSPSSVWYRTLRIRGNEPGSGPRAGGPGRADRRQTEARS